MSKTISDATLKRQHLADRLFRGTTRLFAFLVLAILAAIIFSLLVGAWPALKAFGLKFIFTAEWNPVTDQYGALVPIFGTLATSAIALLIAVPVSFGIALFLTELSPAWLRRPLGIAIELLAGIPSIIYGMWGLFVFAPTFQEHVQPWLIDNLSPWPVFGFLFQGAPMGIGILTAGIILAIMVIPFIASVMRDVFEIVPPVLKESAYGIGATISATGVASCRNGSMAMTRPMASRYWSKVGVVTAIPLIPVPSCTGAMYWPGVAP